MQHTTQVELIKRVFDLHDQKSTSMGDSIYRNPNFRLYLHGSRPGWSSNGCSANILVMCLSSRMPDRATCVTDEAVGRCAEVWLRAMQRERYEPFLNVCRHRGAQVAQGCGSGKKMFVCPYHAWSYDLEERLRSRERSDAFPDISADNGSLVPLPAAEKHGIIWVMTSPGPTSTRTTFFRPPGELASYNLETSSHYQTSSLHKPMNWKLVIDTFLRKPGTSAHSTVGRWHRSSSPISASSMPSGTMVASYYLAAASWNCGDKPDEWDLLETFGDHLSAISEYPDRLGKATMSRPVRSFPEEPLDGQCIAEAALYSPEPATTEEGKKTLGPRTWSCSGDRRTRGLSGVHRYSARLPIKRPKLYHVRSQRTGLTHYHHEDAIASGRRKPPAIAG